jgi:hypothetical protein
MLVPSSSTPRVPLQDVIQVFWALQDASDLSTLRIRLLAGIIDEFALGLNVTRVQQLGEEGVFQHASISRNIGHHSNSCDVAVGEGAVALAHVLQDKSNLATLLLARNKFGDKGAYRGLRSRRWAVVVFVGCFAIK